ncbi:MAG: FAD-binding oxidoreductase [Desulfobacterales bacterium]|nr:FAD-binding oxidoreductase [Desulfobacterales bacterium]
MLKKYFNSQPPWVSEFYVNNAWFDTSKLYEQKPNPPLLDKRIMADIAIVGGGFTGLASAYHLKKKFPEKRIILLEASRCGYGASGRNGGVACIHPGVISEANEKRGIDDARAISSIAGHGVNSIRKMIKEDGLNCDMEENGNIILAEKLSHLKDLHHYKEILKKIDIPSTILSRSEVAAKLKTAHFYGALQTQAEVMLDPAKLALGIKTIAESLDVEIYEQTRALKIIPGKTINIETEFGDVIADSVVIGTNGYSPMLGLFKNRVVAAADYVIATEPLSDNQLASIGWEDREPLVDTRELFSYFRLTADSRIVFGGERVAYYYGNRPSPGNNKKILTDLEKTLFTIWPQLKGVKIAHRWGGTMGITRDNLPLIGVMGEHKNIYYGVGYSGEGLCWTQVAGKIISQLYGKEDTELTRLFFVNRKAPYIPPEPLKKIGVEAMIAGFAIKDKYF